MTLGGGKWLGTRGLVLGEVEMMRDLILSIIEGRMEVTGGKICWMILVCLQADNVDSCPRTG